MPFYSRFLQFNLSDLNNIVSSQFTIEVFNEGFKRGPLGITPALLDEFGILGGRMGWDGWSFAL